MSSQIRPRRRWFQFSLRWLMVLTLVAASFFAGLTYQREMNRRLRDEVERAKATIELEKQLTEVANLAARFHQLVSEEQKQETKYAKREAATAIRELHRELLHAMQQDAPKERDAALSRLEKLMEIKQGLMANEDGSLQTPSITRAYQEPPAFLPQSARDFWRSFRPGGNPPPDGEKAPIKKPRAIPEIQFDQPSIDRTIG